MIYLGKLVNTHGLKGEVRIISDFKYKSQVFKKGSHLFINDDERSEERRVGKEC